MPGLSPRVRGNPSCLCLLAGTHRSIPACAGEPDNSNHYHPPCAVYPRVCGGTPVLLLLASSCSGLSPRVRGNPHVTPLAALLAGSIPACAGEPNPTPQFQSRSPVYPRVCGGTAYRAPAHESPGGLSPRVRGNPIRMRPSQTCERSIPACAGEPGPHTRIPGRVGVYPRVCGGTCYYNPPRTDTAGLSPRVRGNLPDGLDAFSVTRSIPTCAGEPLAHVSRQRGRQVYPRVCGGTAVTVIAAFGLAGLSPRVRGNHAGPP